MEKQDLMSNKTEQKPETGISQNAPGTDRIQWHPVFCSAMELELYNQRDSFIFIREHSLTKKPLSVDFLVIRKDRETIVENDIGKLFKEHNLMEYKSPGDGMGIDAFYKLVGYACIYKAEAPRENGIPAEDITLTLVREEYPRTLISHLEKTGFEITEPYDGIFYAKNEGFFDTQIIVSSCLKREDHIWLASLTRSISYESALKLMAEAAKVEGQYPKDLAKSVLDVVMRANPEEFDKVKKEEKMGYPGFMKLFRSELEEERAEGREQINSLHLRLITAGRIDDLSRSCTDPAFQNKLLQEYGLK